MNSMVTSGKKSGIGTFLVYFILAMESGALPAQIMPLTQEPDGGNKKASVSEQLGVVEIEVNYNRPGVKGREGAIWGTNVAHYGFKDLGHGTGYAVPWRAGANENTTISFSQPVRINDLDLPAGKYGFFICLGRQNDTLVFSKVNNSWGSFYYDSSFDALRVPVVHENLDTSVEWLNYAFEKQTDSTVDIALTWERRKIAFTVKADTKALQMEAFEAGFRTTRPYYDFLSAIYWCVRNDYGLERALEWADRAIYFRVMGEKNFRTLQAKAMVLYKLDRAEEAMDVMKEAMPLGSMQDVHFYGRQLIGNGMLENALEIFKFNYDRYPKELYTHVGMARAYSALGNYNKALDYLKKARPLATTEFDKADLENKIASLSKNVDIN